MTQRATHDQRKQVYPQIRAARFAGATRQNIQTLPPIAVVPGGTISFEVPKNRLLSKISLLINGTFTVTHAAALVYEPAAYNPYSLIRQVRVDINNGFSPFRLSGIGLYLYNRIYRDAAGFARAAAGTRGKNEVGLVAAAGGAVNAFRFWVDLPLTLNPRDPVGLLNVQNPQTTVTVSVDFDALTALLNAPAEYVLASKLLNAPAGYVLASNLTLTPVIETFTIPVIADDVPDLSVLKLVHQYSQNIPGAGDVTFRFPVGRTYRRAIFQVLNAAGAGVGDGGLGNIQLVLNEADIPYTISPLALAAINQDAYRTPLDAGVFVFDFTDQGHPNMGGGRDYVDSERLSEFWLRLNAVAEAGTLNVWTETLATLRA